MQLVALQRQHSPREMLVRSSSRQCRRTRTRATRCGELELERRRRVAGTGDAPRGSEVAKRIALPVLSSAVAKKSHHLEGRVLTLLAQCESLLANSASAYELSSRALPVLQSVGDFREEAKALAVQARSSSALGRNDQAIEAALLGLELAKRTGDAANQADAHSQLGGALFHAGCFDAAKGHLHEARRLAQAGPSPLEVFASIVTEGVSELMRFVTERHETGRAPSLRDLKALLKLHADFARRHDVAAAYPANVAAEDDHRNGAEPGVAGEDAEREAEGSDRERDGSDGARARSDRAWLLRGHRCPSSRRRRRARRGSSLAGDVLLEELDLRALLPRLELDQVADRHDAGDVFRIAAPRSTRRERAGVGYAAPSSRPCTRRSCCLAWCRRSAPT